MRLIALAVMLAGCAAALLTASAPASGAPVTATIRDLYGVSLQLQLADGSRRTVTAGRFDLDLGTGPGVDAFCVCARVPTAAPAGTPYPADAAPAPDTAEYRAIASAIRDVAPGIDTATFPAHEAAALQVAIWRLMGQVDPGAPTDDAAVNARSLVIRDQALARAGEPLGIAPQSVPVTAGLPAILELRGRPGAQATIATTLGTVTPSSVVLGPTGRATVSLLATSAGEARVTATVAGDGRLMVATPVAADTQRLAWLAPADISVTTPVAVGAVPAGVAGAVPRRRAPAPTIGVRKTGPASAVSGRVIRYTIVVRNTGPRRVTGVTVRDRLPRGLVVIRSSSPYTVRSGTIVWSVGALPARARRTIQVWMASATGLRGIRENVAIASARGVRTVRDTAVTRFVPRVTPVAPAVTG